jgi:hypothetical protein
MQPSVEKSAFVPKRDAHHEDNRACGTALITSVDHRAYTILVQILGDAQAFSQAASGTVQADPMVLGGFLGGLEFRLRH